MLLYSHTLIVDWFPNPNVSYLNVQSSFCHINCDVAAFKMAVMTIKPSIKTEQYCGEESRDLFEVGGISVFTR